MAILMFTSRIHELTSSLNRKQARLQELTRKLSDLQQYAANIADGSISMYDMMNTPASMFGRTAMFMMYSHNAALQGAQLGFSQMQPMLAQQMANADPNYQQQYMNWVQQNLYNQERERIAKVEAKLLNQQEKEIQQEKEKVETALKMAEAELESTKKAEEEGIKNFAPKYTA